MIANCLGNIPFLHQRIIWRLQYLTTTRPDIFFTINKLNQFLHTPTVQHWQAYKRVLRYLRGMVGYGLKFQPAKALVLEGFTNVD